MTWYPAADGGVFRDGEEACASSLAYLVDNGVATHATITRPNDDDTLSDAVSVIRRDGEILCVVVRTDSTVDWFTTLDPASTSTGDVDAAVYVRCAATTAKGTPCTREVRHTGATTCTQHAR